jgi:hypothetical protein
MSGGIGRAAWLCAAIVAAAAIASCGGGASKRTRDAAQGDPRSFMMGISTLPRELNAKSYDEAFKLAGDTGELVLIQRSPPWADFLPGADIGHETADTTAAEKQAITDRKLRLFYAIDPTDSSTGRDRLAGLPPSSSGKTFADADIRAAFVSYARYVALNYKPAYLALGVEINLYFDKNKDAVADFKSLYAEAYDRVKEISPDTQVTVTFQYEDLQSILPTTDTHPTNWLLPSQFDPRLDVLAISTYPSFAFKSAAAIPPKYYSQLRAFTDRPIVIAEMGYSSGAGAGGVNSGTEAEQDAFVKRALTEAQTLRMPFIIWFAGWDPAFAKDTSLGVFQHIGLRRSDDTEKPAWQTWIEGARRPYAPN